LWEHRGTEPPIELKLEWGNWVLCCYHACVCPSEKKFAGKGGTLAEFLPRGSVQGWNLPRGERKIESALCRKVLPADGKGMGLKLIAAGRENDVVVGSAFCELLPAQPHMLSFLVQELVGVRMVSWRRQRRS
jgi:hypothetical protein